MIVERYWCSTKKNPLLSHKKRDFKTFPIQIIFQNAKASFHPKKTMRQSILSSIKYLYTPIELEQALIETLDICALDESLLDRLPNDLSGGQLQRFAICRAVLMNPKILIADEITSALDIPVQLNIMKILKKIALTKKMTILFISHDLNCIQYISDNLCILDKGQLIFNDSLFKLKYSKEKIVLEFISVNQILNTL
ncbi:ATP-binding cassette domain-containing protein [Granulicatella sp. zg-ZJ]|uniref:ATP-binding cassette domain-containing protein n=1 Tax=Granulicatella sp. zg-ZJ TaxID=2678504 RepID=UPI0013D3F187|nr:ATP-binding cassette domain-containing protein [Granulicatella sp. zg-ZJ]NEW62411.1 ATP-binding cassette domain-containing protein [Granulicatella sp. zg-ZJ]